MDETTALIYRGINLARELEENLPNFMTANQPPRVLLGKCDEIIGVFSRVKERVLKRAHPQTTPINMDDAGGGFQEWWRINSSMHHSNNAMELLDNAQHFGSPELEGLQAPVGQSLQSIPAPVDHTTLLSSQRNRRRPDDGCNKRTIRVAAPQMGNTDVPPEDGFTWRKYGQKEILGSKYPRAYYRCTHQKLYNCPAKKQVQRLDEDPFTFEVTYRGDHQCYLSSTSPSIPPSSLEPTQPINETNLPIMPPMQSPSTITLGHWLSMNIASGEGTSSRGNFGNVLGPLSTSVVRYGSRDVVDYQNVADLADAMFNSGSSSNNSMDLIFSTMEENATNWNKEERKD